MAARHVAVLLSILALAFALAACGGSGASLNAASNHSVDQAFQNWLAAVDLTAPVSGKVDGLPSIPLDGPSDKGAANVSDPVVKLGADHLQAYNYTDDGTAVRLEAPAHGGADNPPLAYALYKVEGLTGLHPTIMDVEAVPAMLGDNYFIGVADYTTMHWRWFGPYDLPEVEIDLTNHNHRYISESGNLYFLVVTHEGMGLTHWQTTLYFGDGDGNRLPGAPYGLQASDGAIADAVGLAWIAGPHSGAFEIYRALAGDANGGMPPPHGEWALIGTSPKPHYLDQAVDPGVVYLYKVRALNDFGASGFSNVDSGFAGQAPPPDGFRIHGWIRTAAPDGAVGEPVSHVLVTLLGPPQPKTAYTNADGGYAFENLPQGKYIVVPQDPHMFFDPVYGAAIIGPDHPVAEINFTSTGELPTHRIWGFVYSLEPGNPGAPPVFHPMPGVAVNVALGDGTGTPVTVTTNEDGYYVAMELPVGVYVVTPGLAGWHFDPAAREVHVTGEVVTPMANFIGVPDGGGGGDLCVIEGNVTNADGGGLHGIVVYLLPSGNPGAVIGQINTDPDGNFRFGELQPGKYIVVPANPNRLFTPKYAVLELQPGGVGLCTFVGVEVHAVYRMWGFAFNMTGEAPNHFVPMHQVTITGMKDGSGHAYTATTNADGFWEVFELPAGLYKAIPSAEGFSFDPPHAVQEINGTVTPPIFFQGYPHVP